MAANGLKPPLLDLLTVFLIAGGVGLFLTRVSGVPYTVALLVAGAAASVAGLPIELELTHDVILLVVLPPLLFEGARRPTSTSSALCSRRRSSLRPSDWSSPCSPSQRRRSRSSALRRSSRYSLASS